MNYPRRLYQEIKKQLDTREIVVLTGMRRVGKTTLYRMIYEEIKSDNKVFLDLENPLEQRIFEERDYNNIWANLRPYGITNTKTTKTTKTKKAVIFLDEIQAFPDIVRVVKYLYDHYDVKFFLTGSSSFYLKNLFPESLAGRKVVFELYPLDFEEFLIFKSQPHQFYHDFPEKDLNKNIIGYEKTKKLYDEYLQFGGFPQVVLAETEEQKKIFLNDIFKSYYEKDVKALADFRQLKAFRELLLLLFQRIGSKLDISKLSSEVGVSRETVYSYLSFLQGTYFIWPVSPFSRNVDREVSGAKKVYVCDNGIVNHFSRVTEGHLLENAVFLNLRKYGEVQYYQRRSGGEIDFVLPDKKVGIEVKQKGTSSDYKKLSLLATSLGLKEYYVVTKEFSEFPGFIPGLEL